MKFKIQFPVAVHILAVLEIKKDEPEILSDKLARSVNTNPVVIRRLFSKLKKAGLAGQKKTGLGFVLFRPAGTITLRDVYLAVRGECPVLFATHQNPSTRCIVGSHILDALDGPLSSARRAMEDSLACFTIKDIVNIIMRMDASEHVRRIIL
ncbi:MAG: Rrf2 family transcriptional regulator [Spirochaetaceae bacterium]|jgi:DNA-binding IscR family transcriptional regulator|nr:Rrf2 family transcriptional regulator [Spirochaetaceae bacterium]